MTITTEQYAALSKDCYRTYAKEDYEKGFVVGDVSFRILDQVSTSSGYQGIMYQRKDTGEVVVAHRGTEFDRQLVKDGIIADAGMVVAGVNSQKDDAAAFTQHAIDSVAALRALGQDIPDLTITGHSLGGTLAQMSAYRYGLRGETFDPYGAAGLVADIPAGGNQVINHMRATDFVSAASAQFGETRIYATPEDITELQSKGYANDSRRLTDLRNPLGIVFGVGVRAHYSSNFVTSSDPPSESIINDANSARYEQYKPMIDKYRQDVALIHGTLALPRNTVDAVIDAARDVVRHRPPVVAPAQPPSELAAQPAGDPTRAGHPDNAMHGQIHAHVSALDASMGRTPDELSDRVTASLLLKSREAGLTRVDSVLLSAQTPQAMGGTSMFAVQGTPDDPAHRRAQVDTQSALSTPVAESFQQLDTLNQRQTQQQVLQTQQAALEPPSAQRTGSSQAQ